MAVAPVLVSSIFVIAAITILVVFGTMLVQYYTSLMRVRELFRQEIEASKAVLIVEKAYLEENCVILNLVNRGSSSVIIDEHATVLVDYYTARGFREIEVLQRGTGWLVSRAKAEVAQPTTDSVVELKPGSSATVRVCPLQQPDLSKPAVVVVVNKLGVRAEYVYTHG